MKKKTLLSLVLAAAVGLVGVLLYVSRDRIRIEEEYTLTLEEEYTLTLREQDVPVTQTRQNTADLNIVRRQYQLENGVQVLQGRVQNNEKPQSWTRIESWDLPSETGTIWYFDTQTCLWAQTALAQQELNSTCIYIETDAADLFLYVPQGYKLLERQSLQATGSRGYIVVKETGGGYQIDLYSSYLDAGDVCDYTAVYSDRSGALLESTTVNWELWKNYANNGTQRWCYDGFYWIAPTTYEPTGSHVYFRCTASYLIKSMIALCQSSDCAFALAVMMLDTVSACQEDEGCFLTMSRSQWLWDDFGIDGGFYDTRWNSDLILLYLQFNAMFGGFDDVLQQYSVFFLSYAQDNHFETQNGGWFVCDYGGGERLTHCSLNHQLAEMEVLYRLADYLQQTSLVQLADRMLLAIEDTGTAWIRDDGDLHYGVYPDGSYGRDDYPYLTYNDLFLMQETLEKRYGAKNKTLTVLMDAKRMWMQENDITGYMQ